MPPDVYLSPSRPHLRLATEADLTAAAAEGLLKETHYLELKRELGTGRTKNLELARDVCSFAIDGGTIIIGIAEGAEGSDRAPQPLSGLAERIEQVLLTLADPPLLITTTPIPSVADASQGYLVIHVPVSPEAPHMVDNRYPARAETTKRYLSAPEVLRLHQRRVRTEDDALSLLRQEIAKDPAGNRVLQAHLFLLAEPVVAHRGMLRSLTTAPGAQQRIVEFTRTAGHNPTVTAALEAAGIQGSVGDIANLTRFQPRNGGVAMTNLAIQPGRIPHRGKAYDENMSELEVRTDGGLRLYSGSLSTAARRRDDFDGDSFGDQLLDEDLLVTLVRRFLAFTNAAAHEAGYLGNWTVALGATALQHTTSRKLDLLRQPGQPHPAGDYEQATTLTLAQLESRPGAIANDLVGDLLHALRSWEHYEPALSDQADADPTQ